MDSKPTGLVAVISMLFLFIQIICPAEILPGLRPGLDTCKRFNTYTTSLDIELLTTYSETSIN
ncbi:hypothetical protein YC2023_017380 [Brassica napus]